MGEGASKGMTGNESGMTRCPKCVNGRLFTDKRDGESYCINCGWRPRILASSVMISSNMPKPRGTSGRRLYETKPAVSSPAEEELLRLLQEFSDGSISATQLVDYWNMHETPVI